MKLPKLSQVTQAVKTVLKYAGLALAVVLGTLSLAMALDEQVAHYAYRHRTYVLQIEADGHQLEAYVTEPDVTGTTLCYTVQATGHRQCSNFPEYLLAEVPTK